MIINKSNVITFTKRHPVLCVVLQAIIGFLIYVFWPISDNLLAEQSITSTRVLDSTGELLRDIRPLGRGIPVFADAIHPFTRDAVVAIEDQHFYDHFGINPVSIFRALKDNAAAGAVVRGGSTLTMQVARTLRGNLPRTLYQKAAEALLAIRLEAHLTKKEILLLWMNKVYFGNQAYGIEAAARLYFSKSAIDLNQAESAFLAGLPQRPNAYNPYKHFDEALHRQHRVLAAMQIQGHLTADEVASLEQIPVTITPPAFTFKAPHFVEYIRRESKKNLGETVEIHTTLDLSLQQSIEALAGTHLKRLGKDRASNVAAIVVENKSGNILSYVGSAGYWNGFIEGQNDGVLMLRQPGSALKPFTYAIALSSKKHTPASILPDIEIHVPEAGGAFSPLNYDKKFHGPVALRTALASSYNVPAVRLLREYGPASLINMLHSVGIKSLNKGAEHYGVGLTLGNGEVQLLELAQAYTALAGNGRVTPLQTIHSTISIEGDTLSTPHTQTSSSKINPDVAYLVTDILRDPEARSPAFGRYGPLELPFPTAVKTGTSKDYRDNWAVGYTPLHTVAVWVGNFDGRPMRKVSGVSGAGPLFHAIMLQLGSGGDFEQPAGIESAIICPLSGKLPGTDCPGVKKEIFLTGSVPTDTCTVHQVFDIDQRDGSLADVSTPAKHIHPTLFTVFPDEYNKWIEVNGIAPPPAGKKNSALEPAGTPVSNLQTKKPQLVVSYPKSGMTFQIDPVLHPSFQKIKLQGIAPTDLINPAWWINNQMIDGPVQGTYWTLQKGTHYIELRANDADGNVVSSSTVTIQILPSHEEPVAPTANTFR